MMRLQYLAIAGALLSAAFTTTARAEAVKEPPKHYTVSFNTSDSYAFPEGSVIPSLDSEKIKNTIGLQAEFDAVTVGYKHFETSTSEGNSLALAIKQSCWKASATKCALGIKAEEVSGESLFDYSVTVSRKFSLADAKWIEPELSGEFHYVDAEAGTSTLWSASLKLPAKPVRGLDALVLTGKGGISYSPDSGEAKPSWGADLRYSFKNGVSISGGYTSVATYDGDKFGPVNRTATAGISYKF